MKYYCWGGSYAYYGPDANNIHEPQYFYCLKKLVDWVIETENWGVFVYSTEPEYLGYLNNPPAKLDKKELPTNHPPEYRNHRFSSL